MAFHSDRGESRSNVAVDRLLHPLKQPSLIVSTLEGMHMDDNELHIQKAPLFIRNIREPASNATNIKQWQLQKQFSQRTSMLDGMHIRNIGEPVKLDGKHTRDIRGERAEATEFCLICFT
jgi:hypothetical protein